MQYGYRLPSRGALTQPNNLTVLARHAEALGFSFVAAPDHLVTPPTSASRYPYGTNAQFSTNSGEFLEVLTLLAFLAGQTERVRLLSSVLVMPYRQPVLAAKVLATLDYLSGGRVVLGAGVGWLQEEFEALNTPPYAERGAVTDEYLDVMRALWTGQRDFIGKYVRYSDMQFDPKPVQQPHPPIWIGGETGPALRRVVRIGDGWYPSGGNAAAPLDRPDLFAAAVARLHGMLEEAGRDPAEVDIGMAPSRFSPDHAAEHPQGGRIAFTGVAEEIADDIRRYEEAGLGYLMPRFAGDSLVEMSDGMSHFMSDIAALAR